MVEDRGEGALCSNVYATIVVKMFQIYSVQNGKCICETFPAPWPPWHDLVFFAPCRTASHTLLKKGCNQIKAFFKKKSTSHILGGRHYENLI